MPSSHPCRPSLSPTRYLPAQRGSAPETTLRVCPECAGPLVRASGCVSCRALRLGPLRVTAAAARPAAVVADDGAAGGRCSTSGRAAPGSSTLSVRSVLNTAGRDAAWGSGRSTPTSAASSAAPTATRGTPTATPSSGAATRARSRCPAWEAFEQRHPGQDRRRRRAGAHARSRPARRHSLVIGTATDPYQPAERRFRLTRRILEVLLRLSRARASASSPSRRSSRATSTCSRRLGERHERDRQHLARHAGPPARAPARARARRCRRRGSGRSARLTAAGIHAGLLVAPILPGITDDRAGARPL